MATSRREFLTKSAITGAVVWTVPVITSLPKAAWASASVPAKCTGQSFDLRAKFTGTVDGFIDPVRESVADTDTPDPGKECFSEIKVFAPDAAPSDPPIITADEFCVGNDFPPGGPCTTFARWEDAEVMIDLTSLMGGEVLVSIDVLESMAAATCPDTLAGDSHITGMSVTLGGVTTTFADDPGPNTPIGPLPASFATITGFLNEQISSTEDPSSAPDPDTLRVCALHLIVETTPLNPVPQKVDLEVACSKVDIHRC